MPTRLARFRNLITGNHASTRALRDAFADPDAVDRLLAQGADPNGSRNDYGHGALEYAVLNGCFQSAERLLAGGSIPTDKWAMQLGVGLDCFETMSSSRIDKEWPSFLAVLCQSLQRRWLGPEPGHVLVKALEACDNTASFDLLKGATFAALDKGALDHGAVLSILTAMAGRPLAQMATAVLDHPKVCLTAAEAQQLLAHAVGIDWLERLAAFGARHRPDKTGHEALLAAIRSGDRVWAGAIIAQGVPCAERQGSPPIMNVAVSTGRVEIVEMMLDHGVAFVPTTTHQSPLLYAIANGHTECAERLFQAGAIWASPDQETGQTVFHALAKGLGDFALTPESLRRLWPLALASGANPETQDAQGHTAESLLNPTHAAGNAAWQALRLEHTLSCPAVRHTTPSRHRM